MNLKHFTKEGNVYSMKTQKTFAIILIGGLLLVTFATYYAEMPTLPWVFLVLAILSAISIISKKLTIDLDKKEIHAKIGLVKPAVIIPIDSIQNFELYSLSQGFIRTNTALNVYYINKNGKEKSAGIAQGFTLKAMQSILNEIEEILANEQSER